MVIMDDDGVSFYIFAGGTRPSTAALWRCADRVEVMLRASKSDSTTKASGTLISRRKTQAGLAKFDWDWDEPGRGPNGK